MVTKGRVHNQHFYPYGLLVFGDCVAMVRTLRCFVVYMRCSMTLTTLRKLHEYLKTVEMPGMVGVGAIADRA